MSDPNELMVSSEIARLFGFKYFRDNSFKRLGIPVAKEVVRPKGKGEICITRFAYRHDVEAAVARWKAEQERAAPAPGSAASKSAPDVAVTLPLVRAIENLTQSIGVLADRIERMQARVDHLSNLWEPPTTTAPINGAHHS